MRNRQKNTIDWENLIDNSAPDAFTHITPNGTGRWAGLGENQSSQWAGRYNPEAQPGGAWQPGRNNRTGE